MNKRTAVIAIMAVFNVAVSFIILGSVSLEMMETLGIAENQFGTLVMGLFLTSCIVQLFIGPLVDKSGYKPVVISGFALTGLSLLLLAAASSFEIALLASILLGTGAMALNTAGNTLLPVLLFGGKDPARASNFGNGFFGVGYVLTPLVVVFMKKTLDLDYRAALVFFGAFSIMLLVLALFSKYPAISTGYRFRKAFRLLLKPSVLLAALALFCYISLEVSMGSWVKKLMDELYGGTAGSADRAGIVLSLFGVALMAGRFLTAAVENLTARGGIALILLSGGSLVAIVILILAGGPAAGIAGVLIAGIAFAPIFPTVVGITFGKFDHTLYGSIFGIIFATGLLGGTLVPKLIGSLSIGSTVQQSLSIAALMAGILVVVSVFLSRAKK